MAMKVMFVRFSAGGPSDDYRYGKDLEALDQVLSKPDCCVIGKDVNIKQGLAVFIVRWKEEGEKVSASASDFLDQVRDEAQRRNLSHL